MHFSQFQSVVPSAKIEALNVVESLVKPETVQLYCTKYSEGYGVQDEEMYSLWEKLKKLALSNDQISEPIRGK